MTAVDAARDAEAWELMQSAHRLNQTGEWAQAASALEQAAEIHKEAGRDYDEARCLQLAATLRRSAGETQQARLLAERAAAVAPEDLRLAVSIASERGETAFTEGRFEDAVGLWNEAAAKARAAHAKPEGLSAILRRRAAAQMALDQTQAAGESFDEAAGLLTKEAAGFVRTEQAGLLLEHGHVTEAAQILDAVEAHSSAHLRAETLVMRARAALSTGESASALEYAGQARDAALEAVAPVSYLAASAELSQAFKALGDRINAYGAMAAAWATLGDLMGEGVARSWVEPVLLAYKLEWGEPAFAAARRGYETRGAHE
jgi:tetratricopeptide (TPR) repeat protein